MYVYFSISLLIRRLASSTVQYRKYFGSEMADKTIVETSRRSALLEVSKAKKQDTTNMQ